MKRSKRKQTDDIIDYNNNKKPKLQNPLTVTINTIRSLLEDLPNETLYEIFDYLDIYSVHEAFFNLNKRFRNLFLYSNLPIQVNISTMSKSAFEHYHKNIIIPNKHRINYLRLSNPFTVDIVFSPPRIISKFLRLERLVLDHVNAKYLYNILKHAILLPRLHSLVVNLADYLEDLSRLFLSILRLPKLKFCTIAYQKKVVEYPSPLFLDECEHSPIEHLIIDSHFRFNFLNDLLFRLPKLRHLTMDTLAQSLSSDLVPFPTTLKHLKYISLRIFGVDFNQFEQLMKNNGHYVEVLRLTVRYDKAYLNAQRWEQLIVSDMPHLRVIDINYTYHVLGDELIAICDLMNQFHSPFWTERGWFFTHQYKSESDVHSGVFHSTDAYRREDYAFYWKRDEPLGPHHQETNLNSVKHVRTWSTQATDSSVNYFPHATELTIKYYFDTPDDSIIISLNRIVPLHQLTVLDIECSRFSWEQIVEVIHCTPNLHTFKFQSPRFDENSLKLIQQSEIFQYVSKTNKINNLELHLWCHLEEIPFILNLFPQLQYLKTRILRKKIGEMIRYLLTNRYTEARHLFFLCITQTPKVCLREVKMLIESEKLLDDYFIKIIFHDLYLWW